MQIKINPQGSNNQIGQAVYNPSAPRPNTNPINPKLIQMKIPQQQLQPVIRQQIKTIIKPSGPKIELSEELKKDIQALVKTVNEGTDYAKLALQINLIAEQKLSVQLFYGGLNYCCVSGKNLGSEIPFSLSLAGWEGISMIQEELAKVILTKMPVLDLSIYSIEIPTTKGKKELPIMDEVLISILGEERFEELRLKALNQFNAHYEMIEQYCTFERNEIKYYAQSDGILVAGQLFPIWEAKQYVQSQPEIFSEDEIRYLNQVLIK